MKSGLGLFRLVGVGFLIFGLASLARAATLQVTVTGATTATFRYILVVDGSGFSQRFSGNYGATPNGFVSANVPAGSGYRVRIISLNSNNGTFLRGGQALDVTINEFGPNPVTINLAPPIVTMAAENPAATVSGEPFSLTFEITDFSGYLDDSPPAWLAGAGMRFVFGYFLENPSNSYGGLIAKGVVEKIGINSYRISFVNVPPLAAEGFATYSFYATSPAFVDANGSAYNAAFSVDYGGLFHISTGAARHGLILSAGPGMPAGIASISAVVDGGCSPLRLEGNLPLKIGLPVGSGYRVRYYAQSSDGHLFTGRAENVTVGADGFNPVVANVSAWSVVPDSANPATVAAGQDYTLSYTINDAGRLFELPSEIKLGSLSTATGNKNDTTGGRSATAITMAGENSVRVTYAMRAPSAATVEHFQLIGAPRPWQPSSALNFTPTFYLPDQTRGEAPFRVETTAPNTGIEVVVRGVPTEAARTIIKLDGEGYGRGILNQGSTATTTFGVRPGSGYVVRAATVGPVVYTVPALSLGVARDITVTAGSITHVVIELAAPTLTPASDNPVAVGAGQPYRLRFSVRIPGGIDEKPIPLLSPSGAQVYPSTQTASGDVYSVAYSLVAPTTSSYGMLSHRIEFEPYSMWIIPEGIRANLQLPRVSEGAQPINVRFDATMPRVITPPSSTAVAPGADSTLSVVAGPAVPGSYAWFRNGNALAQSSGATLTLHDVQPEACGLYSAVLTNTAGDATAMSVPAIVGITSASKVIGSGVQLEPANVRHPNGNVFDQVLLTGAAEAITADVGQITRTSFIDLNDDIVQVEFSGAGTLTVALENPTGPALPTHYNQAVSYMKGHAKIVVTGANESSNLSIFTVGRATAFDPTGAFDFMQPASAANDPANNGSPLFTGQGATAYDGVADIAFIAIASTNGKFGGLRASNAGCFATHGYAGIYAPGVQFSGPVFIGDIDASGTAIPVFAIGSSPETRITGGNLRQSNGEAVQVAGLTQLKFTAGSTSQNVSLPAQNNQAVLRQNDLDLTAQIVVNP